MAVKTHSRKTDLLRRLPAFRDASPDQMNTVMRTLDLVEVPAGTTLLSQGQHGFEFFLIVDGVARVRRDGALIAMVGPGEVLGEMALIGPGPRNATVVADTDMILATGTRPHFAGMLADIPAFSKQVREASDVRVGTV